MSSCATSSACCPASVRPRDPAVDGRDRRRRARHPAQRAAGGGGQGVESHADPAAPGSPRRRAGRSDGVPPLLPRRRADPRRAASCATCGGTCSARSAATAPSNACPTRCSTCCGARSPASAPSPGARTSSPRGRQQRRVPRVRRGLVAAARRRRRLALAARPRPAASVAQGVLGDDEVDLLLASWRAADALGRGRSVDRRAAVPARRPGRARGELRPDRRAVRRDGRESPRPVTGTRAVRAHPAHRGRRARARAGRRGAGPVADAVADARAVAAATPAGRSSATPRSRPGRDADEAERRAREAAARQGPSTGSGCRPTTGTPRRSTTSPHRWRGCAVPDPDLADAVRRTGVDPLHRYVDAPELADSIRAEVARLRTEVEGTIGVVAPVARHAEVDGWAGRRAPTCECGCLSRSTPRAWSSTRSCVVQPGEIAAESSTGLRTLYVVLTRATQRLVTVSTAMGWVPR